MKYFVLILTLIVTVGIIATNLAFAQYMGGNDTLALEERIGVGLTREITWPPPIKQIKLFEFDPENVKCNSDLVLILKYDGSPACVKPETKQKLVQRGWTETKKETSIESSNYNQKLIALLEAGQVFEFNKLKDSLNLNSNSQISLSGAYLQGLDLRNINLKHVHIEGADMQKASLQGIVLEYKNIKDTNLQGADLRNVDLSDAWLYDVNLQGANLQNANLKNIHFGDSNLNFANLQDADLRGVNFHSFNLVDVNFQNSNLQSSNFSETNLEKLNFVGANMQFANLKYGNLQGANLQNTNLSNTNLDNAELRGANLSGANLQGASLSNTNLLDVNLSNIQNLPISKDEARQRGAIIN